MVDDELLGGNTDPGEGAGATFDIPEEYRDNQDIAAAKSVSDLCKTIVNQQKLVGQKYVGIPNENSTAEEVSKYREAIGVPIKFEDYDIGSSEETKQVFGDDDEAIVNQFKQVMFDAGLSQSQAKQMRAGYDKVLTGVKAQMDQRRQEIDTSFENMVNEKFGSAKEEKIGIAKKFLNNYVSDNLKEYLPNVITDNKSLMVIADIANNVYPELKEDDIRDMGSYQTAGKTEAELRAEMQKIIASDEYQNGRNPGHKDAIAKLDEVAKQVTAIRARG